MPLSGPHSRLHYKPTPGHGLSERIVSTSDFETDQGLKS